MKNILEINNKNEVKIEKKNYHYEKKGSKNDSEEKKEKLTVPTTAMPDRKKSGISNNQCEIMEKNRINIQKDKKYDANKDLITINSNNINISNPNEFKKPTNNINNNIQNVVDNKKKNNANILNINNNIKEPSNEKKRSDSKSSQEDKNSQRKKDPSQLKDFLKNMRDKVSKY